IPGEKEEEMDLKKIEEMPGVSADKEAKEVEKMQAAELGFKPENILHFNNVSAMFKVPYVLYADFECFIGEDQVHVPSGFCLYKVSMYGEKYEPVLYSGPDVMPEFFKALRKEETSINEVMSVNLDMTPLTPDQQRHHSQAITCEACDRKFTAKNHKTAHHDHLTGSYIAPICRGCNLNLKYRKYGDSFFIPVIIHNLRGYDSHLILKAMPEEFTPEEIRVIANNTERYMAFQVRNLRFLDSLQFLNTSLDALTKDLQPDQFHHTRHHFPHNFDLVTRKGVFPYEYMDGIGKFSETSLPPIDKFYSKLSDQG